MDLILDRKEELKQKFQVVGILSSIPYQKCRFIVEKLHATFPKRFAKPEIRPMLNVAWDEYLTKMKRRHGRNFYLLFEPVVVFLDGQFLGDDKELIKFVHKEYILETSVDFEERAHQELINYFQDLTDQYKRKFVYLTIAIGEHVIGAMLFMLYNDLVPETCDNFLNNCCNKESGYMGTRIHRIAGHSFVQCGGFRLKGPKMACENYAVPHDRRGVLSMCNERRHKDNSTQFFITLEPTDWMNYKYVAFGQLIQGGEILKFIERVSTYYQSPLTKILIVNCGDFSLCPKPDYDDYVKSLDPFVHDINLGAIDDGILSVISVSGLKKGKYYLPTDLHKYAPFKRFSTMFLEYLKNLERLPVDDVEFVPPQQPPADEGEEEEAAEPEDNIKNDEVEEEIDAKLKKLGKENPKLRFAISETGILKAEISNQVFYYTSDNHVVI